MDTTIAQLGPCGVPSPLGMSSVPGDMDGDYTPDTARVRYQVRYGTGCDLPADISFEAAGPRQNIYFDPAKTRAAIVTCGGICPGMNNVIRSAFLELTYNYGVPEVYGLRYGYAGLNPACGFEPVLLSRDIVDHIHEHGGTMIGTSRGPQSPEVMTQFLVDQRINLLICVGGDGMLRGAKTISDEALRRQLPIAVVGVPKTIDNDVLYVQRTFGVSTAIERAEEILDCAHIEARSVFNGVGLVKVMGREAGFIACGAALACQEVNLTLIPEMPFCLEGPGGVLEFLRQRLEKRQHALIVVAEGAGQDLCEAAGITDKSGNKKLGDIGLVLKGRITEHFKSINMPVEVKYFDPSYYIRSVRANSDDAIFCDQLARLAVHAGMAGKTGVVIGQWNGDFTHVPIAMATSGKKQVDPESPLWTSVLAATGQPRRFPAPLAAAAR
jgi:6-phosphofructokinase 1